MTWPEQRAAKVPETRRASAGAKHRAPVRRRPLIGLAVGVVGVGLALTLGVACTSTPTVDRDEAVAKVLADSHGQMTEDQARCYVGRVIDEVGADQLQDGANPTPNQIGRLTSIRIDCIGVANLGVPVPATGTSLGPGPSETLAHRVPQRFGDDPQFDALYRACEQGDGAACDSLFDLAAPGTDYEEFAVTCGNRTREVRCADVYRGPKSTGAGPAASPNGSASSSTSTR